MRRRWLWVIPLFLLAGCGTIGSGPPQLLVSPQEATLGPGESVEIAAELKGVDGGVLWNVQRGQITANGLKATYTAPDYPTDVTIRVVSKEDPRVFAEVPIRVRARSLLGPRIRIVSDAALIFTRAGEERTFAVEVYDEAGQPVPDAAVEFVSDDPARFSVERTGPKTARVKALSGTLGTVRIVARYGDAEAWGQAVFAELREEARRLDPGWLLGADWDRANRAWTRIVLRRTPETEALKPGHVVFFGDRTGVWGKVLAVDLESDRVVLATGKAALPDVFKRLSYRSETPKVRIQTEVHPGGAGFLRVTSETGESRLVPLGACSVSGEGVEIREPYIGPVHEFWVEAYVELEFSLTSPLDRAAFVLHGEAGLVGDAGGVTVTDPSVEVTCPLYNDRIRIPVASVVLLNVNVDLYPSLGVYATVASAGTRIELQGPRAEAVASAEVGIRYNDARGWWFVDNFDFRHALRGPSFAFDPTPGWLDLELGPYAGLEIGASVSVPDPVDLTLIGGRFLEFGGELPFWVKLPAGDPAQAGYQGPTWGLGYRLDGFVKLEVYGELADLLTEVFGEGATDLGRARLFEIDEDRAFLHEPRVWSTFSTTETFGIVDLGDGPDPRAEFAFGSDPAMNGTAEVWARGGACPVVSACFSGSLEKLGSASQSGTFTWRPTKAERGVWEVYVRHRIDAISQNLPYSSRPPLGLVTVVVPEFQPPAGGIELRGRYDREATGVLYYQNASVTGVLPDDSPIELASPLQVSLSPAAGLSADNATATVRPGAFGRHALSYACGGRTGTFSTSVALRTNDPEHPEVIVPVTADCTANHPPVAAINKTVPSLDADRVIRVVYGDLVRIIGEADDPDGDAMGCYLDMGDGSPRYERPYPDCTVLDVTHTYKDPGAYVVDFVVEDDLGERDLAQVKVIVE